MYKTDTIARNVYITRSQCRIIVKTEHETFDEFFTKAIALTNKMSI